MSISTARLGDKINTDKKVERGEHHLLLTWLIFTSLLVFAIFVSWEEGLLTQLYETDRSNISLVLTLIYLLVTAHCAKRVSQLSYESNQVEKISDYIHNTSQAELFLEDSSLVISGYGDIPDSMMKDYLRDLIYQHRAEGTGKDTNISKDLIEVYAAKLKGPQEIGWFATDIMLKLGLLGTIIGFIMMLGSVANVKDFDVSTMQKILQLMSSGMGTALYTTMAGLTTSMLAAAQYYMLDRSADGMLERMQHISEVHIKPSLMPRNGN